MTNNKKVTVKLIHLQKNKLYWVSHVEIVAWEKGLLSQENSQWTTT